MKEHDLLHQMAQKLQALQAENEVLKKTIEQKDQTIEKNYELIAKLSARLDILDQRAAAKAYRAFSSGSEKLSGTPEIEEPEQDIPEDDQLDEAEETASKQRSKTVRKPAKRIPIDPSLPREDIVVEPKEFDSICQSCGKELRRIGEDVAEVLDYQPSTLKVKRYIRGKYACSSCKDAGILQAPVPRDRIIAGGIVGNGLLAASISDKFAYHLPYARQSIRFNNIGFAISRQNLSRWQIQVSGLLDPLVKLIEQHILSGEVIHIDETPLKVLSEKDRENSKKSYVWLRHSDGPTAPAVSYRYYPSRSKDVASELLQGFTGMIQSDGYEAYASIVRNSEGRLQQAFCLSHVRRKYYDIYIGCGGRDKKSRKRGTQNPLKKATEVILGDITKIFNLESELRGQLAAKRITQQEFLSRRKSRATKLFEQLKAHVDEYKKTSIAHTPFDGALNYTLRLWDGLQTYLETPYLSPSNNDAICASIENTQKCLQPFAESQNWLFSA